MHDGTEHLAYASPGKGTMALKSVEHDKAGIEPLEMGRVQRTDNTRSGLGLELGLGLDLGLVLG